MRDELDSLKANDVYEVAKLPDQAEVLRSFWVLNAKENENGDVVRFKCRVVANGKQQLESITNRQTFSPVAKMSTIRFLVSLAASDKPLS